MAKENRASNDPAEVPSLSGLPGSDDDVGFFDQLQSHYRECKRKDVEVHAEIEIIDEDGKLLDRGTAVIKNVSPTGALLGQVKLGQKSFPVGGFQVNVRMKSGPYAGIGFRSSPVRFVPEEDGIGVKFDEIYVSK